jgi:outer membrane lipopolysaccharide assembly protein LptE/RlpB
MKKTLLLIPMIAMLAACGTTNQFGKIAEAEREAKVASQKKILNEVPDWFYKVPDDTSAVYEKGYGSSFNMADSIAYAKNDAYSNLCMTAGGKTSQMTKTFSSEGENSRTQINERTIKSMCPNVDLTGVRDAKTKQFHTADGRISTYVLVVLPTGDANILKRAKEAHAERELAMKRAPEAFKELDKTQ